MSYIAWMDQDGSVYVSLDEENGSFEPVAQLYSMDTAVEVARMLNRAKRQWPYLEPDVCDQVRVR